jgi:hypothetical protein
MKVTINTMKQNFAAGDYEVRISRKNIVPVPFSPLISLSFSERY